MAPKSSPAPEAWPYVSDEMQIEVNGEWVFVKRGDPIPTNTDPVVETATPEETQ